VQLDPTSGLMLNHSRIYTLTNFLVSIMAAGRPEVFADCMSNWHRPFTVVVQIDVNPSKRVNSSGPEIMALYPWTIGFAKSSPFY